MNYKKSFYSDEEKMNNLYLEMNLGPNAEGGSELSNDHPYNVNIHKVENIPMSPKCAEVMHEIDNIMDKLDEPIFLEVIAAFRAKFK